MHSKRNCAQAEYTVSSPTGARGTQNLHFAHTDADGAPEVCSTCALPTAVLLIVEHCEPRLHFVTHWGAQCTFRLVRYERAQYTSTEVHETSGVVMGNAPTTSCAIHMCQIYIFCYMLLGHVTCISMVTFQPTTCATRTLLTAVHLILHVM